jgi:putative flippase GtrA
MLNKAVKITKYIIAGGTAAVVDLFCLHIFVRYLHLWYLVAAVIAFLVAFCVSFTLQKFWTFKDGSTKVKTQAGVYFGVSIINLCINTLLMYLFVETFSAHYLVAQFIASGILAVSSYFIYSFFIFTDQRSHILK